jgi:hypothetical protein
MKKSLSIALLSTSLLSGFEYQIQSGWQLLGAVEDITLSDIDKNCVPFVWGHNRDTGNWELYAPDKQHDHTPLTTIHKGDGFWAFGNSDCTILQNSEPIISAENSDQYGELSFGDHYKVINNMWGQDGSGTQNIWTSDDGKAGWKWNWNSTSSSIKSYPAVVYGQRPWDSGSTTSNLPIQLSSLNGLTVSYDVEIENTARHNLAFDIWLSPQLSDLSNTRSYEIMIWTDVKAGGSLGDFVPIGYPNPVATLTMDGIEYKLFSGDGHDGNFRVLSFIKSELLDSEQDGTGLAETIDVKAFIDYLIDNNYVADNEYLLDFEFGTEIMGGVGQATFHSITTQFQ